MSSEKAVEARPKARDKGTLFINEDRDMNKPKFRVWDNVDHMSKPFTLNELQAGLIQFDSVCPVMQFTGLKDVNGNEIYEGDIVQVSGSEGYYVTAKVVYECGAFWFYAENISLVFAEDCDNMVMLGSMYVEHGDGGDELDMVGVIGNIHQNPELLEQNDE